VIDTGLDLEARLALCSDRVEQQLGRWLPSLDASPRRLHEAMRYAAMGGGKRIRPSLVYLTGEAIGVPVERLDGPACAAELIHAYSLAHDDLPAMDDDDLRRGRPTCHKAFDEATAILAGDALQVLAFEILASDDTMVPDVAHRMQIIRVLAESSGTAGMAGGQAIDLAVEGKSISIDALETMHRLKTGALIRASVLMAAWSADSLPPEVMPAMAEYGRHIGLAFQIRDDILDIEGDTGTLGKKVGADQAKEKPTYPSIIGLAEAKKRAEDLCREALRAVDPLGSAAAPLRDLADYIVFRNH
jgi:farnesyl diphosphate synthase